MKRCSKCGKPLTEFEIKFHRNASSGSDLSSQCWNCIRGDELFGRYKDRSLQIKTCLLGLLFFGLLALIGENANAIIFSIIFILMGIVPTIAILFHRSTHHDYRDPAEQHYSYDYSESTHYESTFKDDGTIITEKITSTDSSSTNNWRKKGIFKKLFLGYFMVPTFVFWAIPYIVYAIYSSKIIKPGIPSNLRGAYIKTQNEYVKVPIDFSKKVSFLQKRESSLKVQRQRMRENPLLGVYNNASPSSSAPYIFFTDKDDSYMIIDYHYSYSGYGVCFLLVQRGRGIIKPQMYIGNSYVLLDENDDWKSIWKREGSSEEVIANIDSYISIFRNASYR